MISSKRGFTLVELMVVIAMIGLIIGALSSAVVSARERAKVQKATAEVNSLHQAILAYENFARDKNYELPTMSDTPAEKGSLGFLLGEGGSSGGAPIPTLIFAALSGGETMRDPWNRPYKVTIKAGKVITIDAYNANLQTGCDIPNRHCLSKEERE